MPPAKRNWQSRQPLTRAVPKGLTADETRVYKSLVSTLIREGFAGESDARIVLEAARATCLCEQLAATLARLPSLLISTPSGEKVHPLCSELRAARAQLASLLGALLLTPRARSASRLTEKAQREAAAHKDDLETFLGDAP